MYTLCKHTFIKKFLFNSIIKLIRLQIPVLGGQGNMKKLTKKAAIDQLMPVVIALVAIGITLVVGFLIMAEVASNSKVSADANASAAVDDVQDAMRDIPGWLPIIVITIIGALLIGLVAFFRR